MARLPTAFMCFCHRIIEKTRALDVARASRLSSMVGFDSAVDGTNGSALVTTFLGVPLAA